MVSVFLCFFVAGLWFWFFLIPLRGPPIAAGGYCTISVWNDAGFGGHAGHELFYSSVENLNERAFRPTKRYGPRNMNDRISSFVVETGEWEVCLDAGFRNCVRKVYGPGEGERNMISVRVGSRKRDYNDRISSLRLLRCDRSTGEEGGIPKTVNFTPEGTALPRSGEFSFGFPF